jgi:UDP-GlcNAc3NAcA epimerase
VVSHLKIVTVVGARPQFVKAAVMCRALGRCSQIEHTLIHTGQHYDAEMSQIFFEELNIPPPQVNLAVGSASHAVQTAEMMRGLEPILESAAPDWLLLYGDTNSTLAASLVAAKLCVRQAHVEAGLRSFKRTMPEETNRIVADHLGDLLLCPTTTAMENLTREGLGNRSVLTGDIMYDAVLTFREIAERRGGELAEKWRSGSFALATVHRAENTDDTARLIGILNALEEISETICPVLLPLHPRTQAQFDRAGWAPRCVNIIRPVSYLEMLLLEGRARMIVTDSGGVQKEAYFARVPCITLRNETEWIETLENSCNQIVGTDPSSILDAARRIGSAGPWGAPFGDGNATAAILRALLERQ